MSKLLALLLALPAFAAGKPFSLSEIEAGGMVLRHAADAGLQEGVAESCGLSSEAALELTQPLKALRDEAITRERKQLKRTPRFLKLVKRCEQRCLCGAYADLLEGLPGWGKEAAAASVKASKQDKQATAKCAKEEALSFCKSPLLERLRKDKASF